VAHSDRRAMAVAVDQVPSGTHLEEQLFIPVDCSNGRGTYWYCWRASGGEQLVPVTGVADQVPIGTHLEEQRFIPDDCNNRNRYPLVPTGGEQAEAFYLPFFVTDLISGRVGRVLPNCLSGADCIGSCESIAEFPSCLGRGVNTSPPVWVGLSPMGIDAARL
jgi:hypothetical protein